MIDSAEKIRLLKKLLEKSSTVTVENSDDQNFKSWKNLVERTFIKVFGKDSTEFGYFSQLLFHYRVVVAFSGSDFTTDHRKCFREDFSILKQSIAEYIEELEEQRVNVSIVTESKPDNAINKVFISHASRDSKLVEEMIEVLEATGLDSNQIFCTSFDGYGIELGENFQVLGSIRSILAACFNILKSPMTISSVAGISLS